jgi:hypothetical protein
MAAAPAPPTTSSNPRETSDGPPVSAVGVPWLWDVVVAGAARAGEAAGEDAAGEDTVGGEVAGGAATKMSLTAPMMNRSPGTRGEPVLADEAGLGWGR